MENKAYPNYKLFLESLDYNKEEIEKYFNILTKNLKEEVSSLLLKRDDEIEKAYKEYEESNILHEKIKIDILSKYFKNYIEINEEFNKDIQQLRTECIDKINQLVDILEIQREREHEIKSKLLLEFYEEKKPYQKNIDDINKKIDREYEDLYSIIFGAKEKILNNTIFYESAKKHINELDESINFFNELISYNLELNSPSNNLSLKSDENKLNIYIDFLKNQKESFLNIDSFINEFNSIMEITKNTISNIDNNKDNNDQKIINEKEILHQKFKNIDEEYNIIKTKYDNLIASSTNNKDVKEYKKIEEGILNSLNHKKEILSLESYLKNDLIKKENESILHFKKIYNDSVEYVKNNYVDALNKNRDMMANTFDNVLTLLTDELNNIKSLKENVAESKDIINYFNKRFKSLEIEKRIITLGLYKEYLVKNIKHNQELDCIAFEILTSDQLLRIKELDIRRNYLTIDDEIKIKELKYDKEIEEIERLKNVKIAIKESMNSIELIKKDLEIDFNIKKNELDSKIKKLDYLKNLDILSSDYMSAYTRLENLSKIAKIKGSYDLESIDLSTTLKLEEIIEAALIEATDKKSKFEGLISKYDSEIDEINNEKSQRMRYMNNVLEIERNNFEKRKSDLSAITKNLENDVKPQIIENRKHYGRLLQKLDKEFEKDKNAILSDYNSKNNSITLCQNKANEFFVNYSKFLKNSTISTVRKLNIDEITSSIKENTLILTNGINESINLLSNDIVLKDENKKIDSFIDVLTNDLELIKTTDDLVKVNLSIQKFGSSYIQTIRKELNSIINKFKPESLAKINKKINKLESDRKNITSLLAINNVINSEESYKEIDKIRDSENNIRKEYEKQISDYKKIYLQTIDFIKNDFETKFNKLSSLKEKAIEDNENEQKIIDDTIRKTSTKLNELNTKTKSSISSESDNISNTSTLKIKELSDEIENKKQIYESYEAKLNLEDTNYRNDMIIKAKTYFNELENKKNDEINKINNIKEEKESLRESYIKDLKKESLRLKEMYKLDSANLLDDFTNKKVDNTISYGKLFNKYKEEQESDILNITNSILSFNNDIEEIISSTSKNKEALENKLENNINQLNDNAVSKVTEMSDFYREDN